MHQTIGTTPPRHHGSIRRPRTSRPDMPHLTIALSEASSNSNSSNSPSRRPRPSDAKILRGAQIIRQQLLQQRQASKHQQVPQLSFKDIPDVELSRSISSDEFSDPWNSADQAALVRSTSESQNLQRIALRQKSRPWNHKDLLKSKVRVHEHQETQLWAKTAELTNIQENPVLVEPEQDDSLAWDIDTPPVQSLESYSFPEHGDDGQWAENTMEPRPVSPIPPPPTDRNSPGNVVSRNMTQQAKSIAATIKPPLHSLNCSIASTEAASIDKEIAVPHREELHRTRSNESSCSGSSRRRTQTKDEAGPLPIVTPTHQSSFYYSEERNSFPSPNVVSPLSETYISLVQNDAYRHAMNAGYLWQTLVGQHVRFPSAWWKGARSPPMGMNEPYRWMYIARHRVQSNQSFNKLVRRRDSSGRLLLHIIVRDLVTWKAVQDIVIGCFHSNARGVRGTEQALPKYEDCREIWMAVRKRCDEVSVVDCLLAEGEKLEECARESPLMGNRRHVTNVNIRAIFGDEPPKRTVFILESELYERLVVASELPSKRTPALILLQEFFPDPNEP